MTPSSQQKRIQAIEVLKSHIEKDKSMQLVMTELVAMHKGFLAKVAELQDTINTKFGPQGPQGPKPSDSELVTLIDPLVKKVIANQVMGALAPLVEKMKPQDGKTPSVDELHQLIVPVVKDQVNELQNTHKQFIESTIDKKMPVVSVDDIAEMASEKVSVESIVEAVIERGLTVENIDGLEELLNGLKKQVSERGQYLHGAGVPSLAAGSGISLVQKSDGGYTIVNTGSSSGTTVTDEVLNTQGVGSTFTLAHTPISGSVKLFRGGTRITVGNGDYTISSATITLTTALVSGETLTCDYLY